MARIVPEKYIHPYLPYSRRTDTLCNIGEFGRGNVRIVPCIIEEYEAESAEGALVLQGKYKALFHAEFVIVKGYQVPLHSNDENNCNVYLVTHQNCTVY